MRKRRKHRKSKHGVNQNTKPVTKKKQILVSWLTRIIKKKNEVNQPKLSYEYRQDFLKEMFEEHKKALKRISILKKEVKLSQVENDSLKREISKISTKFSLGSETLKHILSI